MHPAADFKIMDLGDICKVVDAMIDNANDFRTRFRMEYDSIIIVRAPRDMYDKLAAWGAVDYLWITYFIQVKTKEK